MTGIYDLVETIRQDIERKIDFLDKRLKDGLSDIVASLLAEPTCNTHVLSEVLPRGIRSQEHRYQYISRFLKNKNIVHYKIKRPYAHELITKIARDGQTVVLQMDQSKLVDGFEVLMVSVRIGNRALPISWMVQQTEGNIGFPFQNILLNRVYAMLPKGVSALLMADRFYGTKMLVQWCQEHSFGYRIRLKGNNLFHHENSIITAQEACNMGMSEIMHATFNDSEIKTNIGILHEPGHPEPWFIAMGCKPNKCRVLDYGMRWGIEPMFSDFKSRGFGITDSHLRHKDRLERLILVMTLAMYWSVSIGMAAENPSACNKLIANSEKLRSKKKDTVDVVSVYKRHEIPIQGNLVKY